MTFPIVRYLSWEVGAGKRARFVAPLISQELTGYHGVILARIGYWTEAGIRLRFTGITTETRTTRVLFAR